MSQNLYVVTYRVRVRAYNERHALQLANAAVWDDVTIPEPRPEADDLRDVAPIGEGEPVPPPDVRLATPDEVARRRRNVGDA
jgi:hypothetical protein